MSPRTPFAPLQDALSGRVSRDELMARHTTFRIGGPAAYFIEASCVADLDAAISILREWGTPWTVVGQGSNLLVSDAGYDGAVIMLGRAFKRHIVEGDTIRTGAGVPLSAVVRDAFAEGLSGMEFAVGIPGTVGGALAMNAGSRDEWIGGVTESLTLFEPGRGLVGVRGHEVSWGYRTTDLPARGIILEGLLRLRPGDAERIRRTMEASLSRRKRSQPLGVPNAGSVFVNPEGDSAGRLIEAAGLKGAREGGAQVSDVHANFIVNTGGATAADVAGLVRRVRDAVKEQHGIELRPELRFLGPFGEA